MCVSLCLRRQSIKRNENSWCLLHFKSRDRRYDLKWWWTNRTKKNARCRRRFKYCSRCCSTCLLDDYKLPFLSDLYGFFFVFLLLLLLPQRIANTFKLSSHKYRSPCKICNRRNDNETKRIESNMRIQKSPHQTYIE